MKLTADHLRRIARARSVNSNMKSLVVAVNKYGPRFGLHRPYRLAHFLAQLAHESAGFRYDKEIWGPTPAQKRYDTRTDLGNTKARDGDGKKYAGRTTLQITGKANYRAYRDWCRSMGFECPDFVKSPEKVNEDPWEGLAAIWYWETRHLNKYADRNDIEMITRRINGGLNGYADRLNYYTRAALVLMGYDVTRKNIKASIRSVQQKATPRIYDGAVDGIDGPKTRAALHKVLVAMGGDFSETIHASPVVHHVETKVAVAPVAAEKPTKGVLGLIGMAGTSVAGLVTGLDGWAQILLIGFVIVLFALLVTGHLNLAKVIRETREAIES